MTFEQLVALGSLALAVVTIAWSIKQTTSNEWKAGSVGKAYAPRPVADQTRILSA